MGRQHGPIARIRKQNTNQPLARAAHRRASRLPDPRPGLQEERVVYWSGVASQRPEHRHLRFQTFSQALCPSDLNSVAGPQSVTVDLCLQVPRLAAPLLPQFKTTISPTVCHDDPSSQAQAYTSSHSQNSNRSDTEVYCRPCQETRIVTRSCVTYMPEISHLAAER